MNFYNYENNNFIHLKRIQPLEIHMDIGWSLAESLFLLNLNNPYFWTEEILNKKDFD